MPTSYYVLKYLHITGASVLLGTGAGIAFFMLMAHLTGKAAVVASVAHIVVIADFLFTATAVIAQPVTGVALAHYVGYALTEGWIVWSIVLYLITGIFGFQSYGCRCACASSPRRLPSGAYPCRHLITACSGGGLRSASPRFSPCWPYSG